MQATKH